MVEDLFIKLVSIASPSGSESEVGKFVKRQLEGAGFLCMIDGEGNVLARFDGGTGEPSLLSAHLDTVQGESNIKPVVVRGLIKSSGDTILGADNKAAVAAILSAVRRVPKTMRRNLEVIFSVREETNGGVSKIDLNWLKSKVGISADTAEPIGSIISDTPFTDGFEIVVTGKGSHSSEPQKGINALSIASRAINSFRWGAIDDCSTANIGLIAGGSAVNTTPEAILLKGEIRSCKKQSLNKLKGDLEKVFETSAKTFNGKATIKYQDYCEGYTFSKNDIALNVLRKVYKNLKIKENFIKSLGVSDANFFNSKGIKVVDIGDGVANPHMNKESLSVRDLNFLTNIFTNYIQA